MKDCLLAFTVFFWGEASALGLPSTGYVAHWKREDLPPGHPLAAWKPAGPDDVRAPCPMLNTLANHGYLPRDGKDITEEQAINALGSALNIDKELSQTLFKGGVATNPIENATTFSLGDLSRHGILEHDASLSRQDNYFGDNHNFNQAIFDQTRSHWTEPMIDVQAAANAREARVKTSKATNPTFSFSKNDQIVSFGETAAYILALGNKTTGLVDRAWVEYLFENERLPSELGWKRHQDAVSKSDFEGMLRRIAKATSNSEESKREIPSLPATRDIFK